MIPSNDYESPSSTTLGPQDQEPARTSSAYDSGRTSPQLSLTFITEFGEKPISNRREPTGTAPQVSRLARRIHGWSWQAVGFSAQLGDHQSSPYLFDSFP